MDKTKIDILFVRPGNQKKVFGDLGVDLAAIEPPIWAALFAAFLRDKGYSVAILDCEAENLSPEESAERIAKTVPLLVAYIVTGNNLSSSVWNMLPAREHIEAFNKIRSGHVKTLIWGLHPSSVPERTLLEEKVDFVCEGEGFDSFPELLNILKNDHHAKEFAVRGIWYLKDGKPVSNGRSQVLKDLDELPTPAWDLVPMERYRAHNWHCFDDVDKRQPYGVIYASLGCPFNCSFCALKRLFDGKPGVRFRSPEKFMEDLDVLVNKYGIRNIKILDECFVLRKDYVEKVCDMIISRGYDLNMWAYARIDTVDENILKKLRKAGVRWIAYGIEAGSKKVRDGVSKGRFTQEDIKRVIKLTKDAGIYVVGNFMFGLPDDDLESMKETLDMAKELNCEYTNFYVTMAYPGTQLHDEAIKNNVKLPESWIGYSQYSAECLPLSTKHISAADVLKFRDQAFVDFHASEDYLSMMRNTFGLKIETHIKGMLSKKIKRNLLSGKKGAKK
ncbi:MAG: radical SAM protein [Candidatus Margulisiibacteriota bacterium]